MDTNQENNNQAFDTSYNQFLVFWCCEGLEYIGDITEEKKKAFLAKLRGEDYVSQIPNIMHLRLRAQYNTDRCYELYVIETDPSITVDTLKRMFASSANQTAKLIRQKGTKIFGNSLTSKHSKDSTVIL